MHALPRPTMDPNTALQHQAKFKFCKNIFIIGRIPGPEGYRYDPWKFSKNVIKKKNEFPKFGKNIKTRYKPSKIIYTNVKTIVSFFVLLLGLFCPGRLRSLRSPFVAVGRRS